MAISALLSRNLRPYLTALVFCFSFSLYVPIHAQQNSEVGANQNASPTTQQSNTTANSTPSQRAMLQQELHNLLAENTRINKEKIQFLEAQSQRVFWTQCLIGFLVLMMLISLFSFWRLHVQHKFQHGIDALTTSLKHFQDSLFSLSFIDTSQLSTVSNISSFHIATPEAENSAPHTNSAFRKTINPNTGTHGDEFSDIRGFFDAWLNVYKPGDPRYEEALAAANKPESPRPWLHMLDGFLQNKDQHGFESISKEIKKFFNVKLHAWQSHSATEKKQLSDYPHVQNKILELWPTDEVVVYLERLLNNSRMSPREGFDLNIFEQLETLFELAQQPNRPRRLPHLKSLGIADFLFHTSPLSKPEVINNSVPSTKPVHTTTTNRTEANLETESKHHSEKTASNLSPTEIINKVASAAPVAYKNPIQEQALQPRSEQAQKQASTKLAPAQSPTQAIEETVAEVINEQSVFAANEVRLQLAHAYIDIADSEGACLLLEDVIQEAVPAQQEQARQLLMQIEKKQARICGNSEEIYFADSSALTAAKKA
ncbi:FimV/HubP family polar landmark protein [Undibacterium flavidum]|uniref:Uncharacterized protein n=1 Tax=Undibacterium flavidum TaxID=2762297 RepID=A0ABR6Y8D1_9BURK|nr:FimV/HubP family polar landmark protein [Undibacterium flavidum]MBC3872878.1 hypothetical protein [Undibacterium flavidum]